MSKLANLKYWKLQKHIYFTKMSRFKTLFHRKPHIIGMIHVKTLQDPLSGSSFLKSVVEKACRESEIYAECGVDSVLIENMHDVPYVRSSCMGPETVSAMTRICSEVRNTIPRSMSCGVQILAGGNKEAIAVAHASDLQFIRVEGYVYGHIADEGFFNSCAGSLYRYRRNIQAEDVLIFADIKKKHCSHAITSDISVEETAKAAEFFLSDGIILTGSFTGDPTSTEDFVNVKKSCKIPILIGSGVNANNIGDYLEADGIIIGSDFKKDGRWENEVDKERITNLMANLNALQNV